MLWQKAAQRFSRLLCRFYDLRENPVGAGWVLHAIQKASWLIMTGISYLRTQCGYSLMDLNLINHPLTLTRSLARSGQPKTGDCSILMSDHLLRNLLGYTV